MEEFTQLMLKLDADLSRSEIQMVFDEIDTDGNGDIDFIEFRKALRIDDSPNFNLKKVNEATLNSRVYKVLMRLLDVVNKYKLNLFTLFSKYDTSQNGSLDRKELHHLFHQIDSALDDDDVLIQSLNNIDSISHKPLRPER
jgi:Ca2+-binding EF-hand superfamily protein